MMTPLENRDKNRDSDYFSHHKNDNDRKNSRCPYFLTGFTLVEVLISLSILSVGMVMVFQLFLSSLQSLSYSNKLNEISRFAEKKLEELKTEKGELQTGETSGKENDLDWKIIEQPLKLTPDLEVIFVELDINFNFQGNPQTQKFVTYLYED